MLIKKLIIPSCLVVLLLSACNDVRRTPGPPGAPGPPARDHVPPVRGRLGAAGSPAFLPGVPGAGFQPAHDREHALAAGLLAQGVTQRERRCQQPGKDVLPGRPGLRPRRDHRPRGEPCRQLRAGPACRPRNTHPGRLCPAASWPRFCMSTSIPGISREAALGGCPARSRLGPWFGR